MKIGITGHQNIDNYDILWIKNSLIEEIKRKRITLGYSSLAIGIDQLFVTILIQVGIPYEAIIPCRGYEETFESKKTKSHYLNLLKKAKGKLILDFKEPSEQAFYAAGKQIIELADIMFAVWDGKRSKGLGGTADIVSYALSMKKQVLHINPINKTQKTINYND